MLYYTYISLMEGKSMATKKAKKSAKKTAGKKITTVKPVAKAVTTVKAETVKTTKSKTSWKDRFTKYKSSEMKNGKFAAALVAEFLGTFAFVAFYMETQGDPRYAIFALLGITLTIGTISGSFINPAMTIGALIARKIKYQKALGYVLAQTLGAVAAWSVLSSYGKGLSATTSLTSSSIFTATAVTAGKEWYVFFAEIIGAAILSFGLASALKSIKNHEIAINGAFAYAGALFIAMFITYIIMSPLGTGLVFFNPAIAFAASAVKFQLWPIAIYVIAPIIGSVLGFVLIEILHSQISISVKDKE